MPQLCNDYTASLELSESRSVDYTIALVQSYEIKSPLWTISRFRILGIFSVENIDRLGVFMLH